MSACSTPRKPQTRSHFASSASTPSTLAILPPFSSTSRPRLQALYADISRQKTSNPESYHANIEWWRRALEVVVSTGYLDSHALSLAKGSRLVLSADQGLVESLRVEGVGKPLALGAVIPELTYNAALIPLSSFLTSSYSIYPPSSSFTSWLGVPTKAAWYLVGKPVSWALERAGVTGEDGIVTSLTGRSGGSGSHLGTSQGVKAWFGEYVARVLVERAADEVMRIQREKDGEGAGGRLYNMEGFRRVFSNVVGVSGVVDGLGVEGEKREDGVDVLLDEKDAKVLLKYLERDRGVLVVGGDTIKFVAPMEERSISAVDEGILELKNAVENMQRQIERLQTRISRLGLRASNAVRDQQKSVAVGCLKSRKQLQEVLERRLGSLQTLEATLYSVEEAADNIQVMRSYESSTATLRAILSHPSLKKEKVEETMEAMAEARDEARDVDEAIRIGGDIGLVDESEVEEELSRMVEEMKLEERIKEQKRGDVAEARQSEDVVHSREKVAVPA